jgi:hypothetical protein
MLISLGDAPIHAYHCAENFKLSLLKTTSFFRAVCPVGVFFSAKTPNAWFYIYQSYMHIALPLLCTSRFARTRREV